MSEEGAAFGLRVVTDFAAPGVAQAPSTAAPSNRVVRAVLDSAASPGEEEVVHADWGGARLRITRSSQGALHFDHSFFGRFALTDHGRELRCEPAELPPWQWQRFLVGQLLPAAALAQGLGPMHCAAAEVDGGAVLLLGTSGAGKTTTLLSLVARGAGFLADDVAALELAEGTVVAHPGSALCNLDHGRTSQFSGLVGPALGTWDGEDRVTVEAVHSRPIPVSAVWVLVRDRDCERIEVGDPDGPWPAALLGAHFNAALAQGQHTATWLDLIGLLCESARLGVVRSPLDGDPARVAATILGA